MTAKPNFNSVAFGLLIALTTLATAVMASEENIEKQLEHGDVVVGLKDIGKTQYVTARVIIDAPPDQVWPIMVNPFEFEGKISPRMKAVEVVSDQTNRSVLRFTVDAILIPRFTYTVESLYDSSSSCESIQFHSVDGMLKDFRGSWVMTPVDGGKTELAYCMYIDPGFSVPQWMVREAVKHELPQTLTALRKRVETISQKPSAKEKRTILAAFMHTSHSRQYETK